MTVWVVGDNQPGFLPDSENAVFADFDEAVEHLKYLMKGFAEENDAAVLEDPDADIGEASREALVGAIFDAVDGPMHNPDPGEVSFQLEDVSGWPRAFWVQISDETWYHFPGYDDELRDAQGALDEWIRTFELDLPEEDQETLFQHTDRSADAATNIAALAQGAIDAGLNLDDLGYPLPVIA